MNPMLGSGFGSALKARSAPALTRYVGVLLVVDDEPAIAASIADQLRGKCRILSANGADEAESIWRTENIAVILSDQRMPGVTGAELLARAAVEREDTTRLLITGYADIEAVIQAVNQGMIYHYLVKPWQPDELVRVVDKAFERNRLLQERRALTEKLRRANAELEVKVKNRTWELEEKNVLLEELNLTKNQFLGMAAHDLAIPAATS